MSYWRFAVLLAVVAVVAVVAFAPITAVANHFVDSGVNSVPTADAQAVSTVEDTSVMIELTGADPDPFDDLTFSLLDALAGEVSTLTTVKGATVSLEVETPGTSIDQWATSVIDFSS
ncbi:MAG: hypothetical protein ABGW98_14030, partial [Myxococcales bacterium]